MPCSVGYPKEPCPFSFEGRVTRESCGACKNFQPPGYILSWCMLWDRDRILCKLPKTDCEKCPFKNRRQPGRPFSEGGVDWQDAESVKKYMAEWRAKHAEQEAMRHTRFVKQNPEYFKTYYQENKEKLLARVRAYQERVRDGKQGKGQVR